MLVTLSQHADGDEFAVGVSGPDVSGVGIWCGRGEPTVGTPIEVELDVPDVVAWGEIVTVSDPAAAAPEPTPGALLLSGVVERPDEDGVAVLRVADSTVRIETSGTRPSGVTGERVTLLARGVGIYPTGT